MIPRQTRTHRKLSPGHFAPLGATLSEDGVNFALYSQHATEVWLLLFEDPAGKPTDTIRLERRSRFVWHVFVHGVSAGQLYGYKVCGPFDPRHGLRFNTHKLLIDPYARALTGPVVNVDNLLLSYEPHAPDKDLSFDDRDSTRVVPKSIVVDDRFDWQDDQHPEIALERAIIYETHLKGFTAHPSSGVSHPGTYLGFIEKIPHLKELGITTVELLPVQQFYCEDRLLNLGLTNYWGYNTIAFFAPEIAYSTRATPGCQVVEFKTLVRELHRAGIEVILDVVYNHTGEGNEMGPTVSLKGVDNTTYYSLTGGHDDPRRRYFNYSGCGNTIAAAKPPTIRLIADSLRYWVEMMHVDGFRFDLATILARSEGAFSMRATFFDVVSQDPVLSRVKLIAEPWDIDTYQVGRFPIDWSEWNGRFRDTIRRYVKGDPGQLADLGWRLCGSEDLYAHDGRTADHSVNFVTCHDGFTLQDLVSYDRKHNEANAEGNRDGTNDNESWNCGAEGETNDRSVVALRRRQAKNMMCLLFVSLGTPMMLGGDEFLRTQRGNNNPYCQDNETSWLDWRLARTNEDFLGFTRDLIRYVKTDEALSIAQHARSTAKWIPDRVKIAWYGRNLDTPAWQNPEERTLAMSIGATDDDGVVHHLLILLNSDPRPQTVRLPALPGKLVWHRKVDTSFPQGEDLLANGTEVKVERGTYTIGSRTIAILKALQG